MPLKKTPAAIFPSFSLTFFLFAQQLAFNLWEPLLHFLEFLFCCCGVFDWFSCLEKWWDAPCPQKAIHVHAPIYMMLPHPIESDREAFILIGEQKCLLEPWLGPTTCSFHPQLFASPPPPFFWEGNLAGSATKVNITGFLLKKAWFDTYQGNDKKGLHTMKKPVAMVFETSNTKPWIATWINILDAYSIINTCQILKKTIQKTSDIPPHFDIHCIILRISSTLRPPWLQRFGVAFWPPPRGVALQWPNARPERDWDVTGWDVYLSLHGTIP